MRKPPRPSATHDTNGQPESWSRLAGSYAGAIVKATSATRARHHIKQWLENRQLPPTVVAARTVGAMLDLAPKQPGTNEPLRPTEALIGTIR